MRRLMLRLSLVLFLICAPLGATAGVITDTFDDGNADGWKFLGFDPRGPGEWSVENQVLVNRASTDGHMGLLDNLIVSNQIVEVQVKTSGYAGVTLWFHDEYNSISTAINPFSTGFGVYEVVNGNATTFLYDHRTSPDTWYDFRVEANSQTGELAIYLNNSYVLTHQTSSLYRSGLSGVGSGNATAYFDNFRLTSDDVVPEPASLALWGIGLVGLVAGRLQLRSRWAKGPS